MDGFQVEFGGSAPGFKGFNLCTDAANVFSFLPPLFKRGNFFHQADDVIAGRGVRGGRHRLLTDFETDKWIETDWSMTHVIDMASDGWRPSVPKNNIRTNVLGCQEGKLSGCCAS